MKLKKQFRAQSAEGVKLDKEARTVEFPFSSEYPVERWFGTEILSHDPSAADLSRLNDGGAMLWNHNMDTVIGVIDKAEMRSDQRVWATARFSQNEKAQEIMRDVEDGILRNVSFGYQINEMKLTKAGSNGTADVYTATNWAPFEVSIVSIPADPTVGIGRADSDDEREVRIINERSIETETTPPLRGNSMDEKEKAALEAKVASEARANELARIKSIEALGEKFGKKDLARQLIEGGKTIEESRTAFLEMMGAKQVPITGNEAVIGLTNKEKREYSFLRAMRAQLMPNDKKAHEDASFERECHEAAMKHHGKAPRGFLVPVDVLRHSEKRDLTVGSSTAGGNLVATDLLAASFIELLRVKSVMQAAGATVMNGLVGNIAIPKQTGASTAYWVAENNAVTEGAQTVGQVSMSPKTVGAFTDYSRKLVLQSSIDVESFVRNDIAAIIALEIDRVALYGLGSSNQPQGLKPFLTGSNSASQESNFAGATPTFSEVVGLETKVTAANGDVGAMKYLVNASMNGALKTAVKVSSYPVFILENGQANGYPVLVSNQVASGDVWFGVWSQLMMGFWSGLDLLVDPYTGSTAGTVRIVALQDCDIAARHYECFARGNDNP